MRPEAFVRDCAAVLNGLDAQTLKKSLRVLKPGGKLISLSGPPDPEFARSLALSRILESTKEAMAYVDKGRANGKVVVEVR